VLLTGATGALGPHLARWLATAGATHLVLVSRRGRAAAGAAELEAELVGLGARVSIEACDVTDRDALGALLDRLRAEGCSPRTVVHAAAQMQLAPLSALSVGELADVLSAKVTGAALLDELLDGDDVETVIYFSSIAAVWGSGDHGAYAAANAYLDALAERRRSRGHQAISVAWGVWNTELLPAAVDPEHLRRQGVPSIDVEEALAGLQQVLDTAEGSLVIADIDWQRFLPVFASARARPLLDEIPEVVEMLREPANGRTARSDDDSPWSERMAGLPEAERERVLLEQVQEHIAAVLKHDVSTLPDPNSAFREMGFDSLTVVELRNRIGAMTGLRLPVTLVFDHPNPTALVRFLRSQIRPDAAGAPDEALDAMEAYLPTVSLDDGHRARLAKRLHALLRVLDGSDPFGTGNGVRNGDGDGGDDDDFDSTTDDEMFELIDREFGRS